MVRTCAAQLIIRTHKTPVRRPVLAPKTRVGSAVTVPQLEVGFIWHLDARPTWQKKSFVRPPPPPRPPCSGVAEQHVAGLLALLGLNYACGARARHHQYAACGGVLAWAVWVLVSPTVIGLYEKYGPDSGGGGGGGGDDGGGGGGGDGVDVDVQSPPQQSVPPTSGGQADDHASDDVEAAGSGGDDGSTGLDTFQTLGGFDEAEAGEQQEQPERQPERQPQQQQGAASKEEQPAEGAEEQGAGSEEQGVDPAPSSASSSDPAAPAAPAAEAGLEVGTEAEALPAPEAQAGAVAETATEAATENQAEVAAAADDDEPGGGAAEPDDAAAPKETSAEPPEQGGAEPGDDVATSVHDPEEMAATLQLLERLLVAEAAAQRWADMRLLATRLQAAETALAEVWRPLRPFRRPF
eukprot:SAG25_NODE_1101_length_3981_cov_5.852396_3_plen_409_part_00